MNSQHFKIRRDQLMQRLDANSIAVVLSAPFMTRSNDTEYPYRQESNFYYLTGLQEDHCALVLDTKEGKSYLFVKEVSEQEALWVGSRLGAEGVKKEHVYDDVFNIEDFEAKMKEMLKERSKLYLDLFGEEPLLHTLRLTCKGLIQMRGVLKSPRLFADITQNVQAMRLIKSDEEIALMRHALTITKEAHHRAMREAAAGMKEYVLEAEIEYVFAKNGAAHNAYGSIVAGGNNANVLHYVDNRDTLKNGDLVLIDAGCEYEMYASDITRTFPVNGTFTDAQREVYEMVLKVQLEIIDRIRPGVTKKVLQDASERLLCEGMVRLGILQGEVDSLMQEKAHKKYYPHGIGHWLGIDVHDPCPYVDEAGEQVVFAPGMVLTIEPGVYIKENDTEAPERYRGIGIRIEDDILITADGHENLSQGIAKTVDEIESACSIRQLQKL